MRRVLVVAPNWIGDALMAQPLFMLLKKRYPRLAIDALAPAGVAPIFKRMPEIDQVFPNSLAHRKLQLWQRWILASQIRDTHYDAAYILPNSLKSALIPWLAGIKLRVGYLGEQRYGLLNARHSNPPRNHRPPMSHHYAALAFAPGIHYLPEPVPYPHLDSNPTEIRQTLQRFKLDSHTPLILFCPGAEYGPAKRWPAQHFATLAQRIRRAFPYAQVAALGAGRDAATAQDITESATLVRNLCGQTTLDEACALIAHAAVVVSNDSGLMHIAAALRRPLIALYGSSDPRHTPPLSNTAHIQWLHLECSPCFKRECPLGHFNCMRELDPERVFEVVRTTLLAQR